MQKKLKSSGNGWELYFPKPILKILGYNPLEVRLLITSKKSSLYIEPINEEDTLKYQNNMVRRLQKKWWKLWVIFSSPSDRYIRYKS